MALFSPKTFRPTIDAPGAMPSIRMLQGVVSGTAVKFCTL